jgi:hypothetical protein
VGETARAEGDARCAPARGRLQLGDCPARAVQVGRRPAHPLGGLDADGCAMLARC